MNVAEINRDDLLEAVWRRRRWLGDVVAMAISRSDVRQHAD